MSKSNRHQPPRRSKQSRRRTMFVFRDNQRYRISINIFITLTLIFLGGLGTAVSYAFISDTQNSIRKTREDIQIQKEANASLRAELTQKYSLDEVERIATERLGMIKIDPSQSILINVPKQSFVILNDDEELPEPDSLWQTIWNTIKQWFE